MPDSEIIVYGSDWCGDCRRARRFLNQYSISYQWVNIEQDKNAEKYVLVVNKGMRSIPTILFQDGSILVEPTNAQLAHKLRIDSI